jgi:predicted CXXCH cytochrome family protein
MRNRTLLAVLASGAALWASSAVAATIVGSRHDLRAIGGGTPTGSGLVEVCAVCHTPHQAAAANAQYPLWNHTGSATGAFGVYGSPTLQASPQEIGGEAMGGQSVSRLCMGCHDGTVSVLSMYNPPNSGAGTVVALDQRIDSLGRIISNSHMGNSLVDDHPVNFLYDTALATADGGLVDPAGSTAVSDLLIGGMVGCASCHDVHDPANVPFLVTSNTASALCLTCHVK